MHHLKWPITAVIMLMPALALAVKGAANASFYLLVLGSLIAIVLQCRPIGLSFSQVLKKYWYLHVSMAGTALAIMVNQAALGDFVTKSYDTPSRFALFALYAWLLLSLPIRNLKLVQWGFVAGAIVAAINIRMLLPPLAELPSDVGFLNRIPYGDISLLLGFFSLLSIGWNKRNEKGAILLKVAGGCAGLYASYYSQIRGGWVALPVLAAIGLAVFGGLRLRQKVFIFSMALAALGAVASFSPVVETRVDAAEADMEQYVNGNVDTSLGIRFQLWHGSWVLFEEHPLVGVGREHFHSKALPELHARNIISEFATQFGHSHNEFLFNAATLGIAGLISFFAIYFVPGYFFFRAARDPDQEIKTAGSMGLALCSGYFVFSLTEAIFDTPVSCAFYGINAAVFFALIVRRRKMLEQ